MPLAYGDGTIAEHRACRQDAVAFDVSHLGTVRVEGADAFDRLQSALTNDLAQGAARDAPSTPTCSTSPMPRWSTTSSCGGSTTMSSTSCPTPPTPTGWWRPSGERTPPPTGRSSPSRGPTPGPGPRPYCPRRLSVPRFGVQRFELEGGRVRGRRAPATPARTGSRWPCRPTPAPAMWEAVAGTGVAARRAGRPRHPSTRGGAASPRPRTRTGHHPAPGRTRLGRRVGQGRLPRSGGPGRRTQAGRGPAPGRTQHRGPSTAPRGCVRRGRRRPGRHGHQRQLLADAGARHRPGPRRLGRRRHPRPGPRTRAAGQDPRGHRGRRPRSSTAGQWATA